MYGQIITHSTFPCDDGFKRTLYKSANDVNSNLSNKAGGSVWAFQQLLTLLQDLKYGPRGAAIIELEHVKQVDPEAPTKEATSTPTK